MAQRRERDQAISGALGHDQTAIGWQGAVRLLPLDDGAGHRIRVIAGGNRRQVVLDSQGAIRERMPRLRFEPNRLLLPLLQDEQVPLQFHLQRKGLAIAEGNLLGEVDRLSQRAGEPIASRERSETRRPSIGDPQGDGATGDTAAGGSGSSSTLLVRIAPAFPDNSLRPTKQGASPMFRLLPLVAFVALMSAAFIPAAPLAQSIDPHSITWKKTVLDRKFRSEGVAVADVNKDGKIDVLNGEYWYEAPDWKPHEMQPPHGLQGRRCTNYSRVFFCWAEDLNGDGYPDLIVIDFPGDPCYWMENPKGKDGHWKKHIIWHSACNETPPYADLFGTGKRVLVMGLQPPGKETEGQMAYFTPGARTRRRVGDAPDQRAESPGQGNPRHPQVQPRPRRRRPQRRRPQRRDLHRRLVGAAGEGGRQDAVDVPPGQPRRGLRRHVRLRRGRRRQGRRPQHVRPPVRHLVAQAADDPKTKQQTWFQTRRSSRS